MQHNYTTIFIGFIIAISIGFIVIRKTITPKDKQKKWTVGILQTASHPALDAARNGFIDTVQKSLDNDVEFIIRNGEGSISSIHTIAQQFYANKSINAIYAIATPAAQAVISIEDKRPIFVAAVTVAPKIETISITPQVCGVSDMIDVPQQIVTMKSLLPQIKTVGVLFNISEINSSTIAHVMLKELTNNQYYPIAIGFTSQTDMIPALEGTIHKVDAILAPTDNTVASSITLLTHFTQQARKPFIVSDNSLVKYGALMARGVDYYENGKEAGNIAIAVLRDNKKPYEIGIRQTSSNMLTINNDVVKNLSITIPPLEENITFVSTEH